MTKNFKFYLFVKLLLSFIFMSGEALSHDTEKSTFLLNKTEARCSDGTFDLKTLSFCDQSTRYDKYTSLSSSDECNPLWQKKDESGRCVAKYFLEVCDSRDSLCDRVLKNRFHLTEIPIECEDGVIEKIILPTQANPNGEIGGFALILIEVLACVPITKFPPTKVE